MLVLSRKVDERILIGDDIVVSIVRVRGNTVRLGIEAPAHVQILRSELATTTPPQQPAATKRGDDATS
jgi:carbon storage regulator